jgi:hypothetical protein
MTVKVKLPLDNLNAEALKDRGTDIVAAIAGSSANFATRTGLARRLATFQSGDDI